MAVASGQVSVGTSPTKICTAGEGGVVLVAATASVIFVGGPNVSASAGASQGVLLSTTTPTFLPGARTVPSLSVPAGPDNTCDIYGIVATTPTNVNFFAPQGG